MSFLLKKIGRGRDRVMRVEANWKGKIYGQASPNGHDSRIWSACLL